MSRARVKTALRWLLSLAAVAFVVWMLPLHDRCTDAGCQDGLLTTFRRTNPALLAGMFAVYLVGTVAWAARWAALLRPAGVELPLGTAWRVTLEAQAGGILLPGGVAGDALRVAYAKERSPGASVAKVTASIVADRIVGLVTLSTIALSLGLAFGAERDRSVAVVLPMLGAIPIGAVVLWLVVRRPRWRQSRLAQTDLGRRFILPFLEYAGSEDGPRALRRSFALSFVVSGCQLLVVRGLITTVGGTSTVEGWLHVGAAFSMIVAAIPVTPGGWGTTDAAYVFFLGRGGVGPASAAAVCLLYRLMWYATGSIGAVSAFARTNRDS